MKTLYFYVENGNVVMRESLALGRYSSDSGPEIIKPKLTLEIAALEKLEIKVIEGRWNMLILNQKELEALELLVLNEVDYFKQDQPDAIELKFYTDLQKKLEQCKNRLGKYGELVLEPVHKT